MPSTNGHSKTTYVTVSKAKEAVTVFKEYLRRNKGDASVVKKRKLEDMDDQRKQLVLLDVTLKKHPLNHTVHVNTTGPLPHPWKLESSAVDVCLIVRSPGLKKGTGDRDLDFEQIRSVYREKLTEAGFEEDFIKHRLVIIPMSQLLTEYKDKEAKGKLSVAYDVFLADNTLMKSKYSGLNASLGSDFFFKAKKVPIPVNLKLSGSELKVEITNALDSTHIHDTGRGTKVSVKIACLEQKEEEVAYNLIHVLKTVKRIYGVNVQSLSLRLNRGCPFTLPFFLDQGNPNDVKTDEIAPRTRKTTQEKDALELDKSAIFKHPLKRKRNVQIVTDLKVKE